MKNARTRRSRIAGHLRRSAQERGYSRERLVGDALAELREEGAICTFYMCPRNGHADKNGIDAVFVTLDGEKISFQVKGSLAGVRKHEATHPNIPCVDVGACLYVDEAKAILRLRFYLPDTASDGLEDSNHSNGKDAYGIAFIPIQPSTWRARCVGGSQNHRCHHQAVLQVVGMSNVCCCKSRKCREKAAGLARRVIPGLAEGVT